MKKRTHVDPLPVGELPSDTAFRLFLHGLDPLVVGAKVRERIMESPDAHLSEPNYNQTISPEERSNEHDVA